MTIYSEDLIHVFGDHRKYHFTSEVKRVSSVPNGVEIREVPLYALTQYTYIVCVW